MAASTLKNAHSASGNGDGRANNAARASGKGARGMIDPDDLNLIYDTARALPLVAAPPGCRWGSWFVTPHGFFLARPIYSLDGQYGDVAIIHTDEIRRSTDIAVLARLRQDWVCAAIVARMCAELPLCRS